MKKDYTTEAQKLARAIDIAMDSYKKYPPAGFGPEQVDHVLRLHKEWKHSVLNPEPQFRKMASLNYSIQDVFTFFQEGHGPAVEYFWQQIEKEKLGYVREDKLRKIIVRGKIKNHLEYDLVIDTFVAAEQEGRITKQEAELLGKMIGEFESRN